MSPRYLRLLAGLLVIGVVLGTATVTLGARQARSHRPVKAGSAVTWPPLTVPDVRGQVYVFAKGMLEEAGFAFRVQGSVPGYASNRVVVQQPAPGTKVVNTGAPTVTLKLASAAAAKAGVPQNAAPYRSTPLRLYHRRAALAVAAVRPTTARPAVKAPAAKRSTRTRTRTSRPATAKRRRADFVVAGAPREPLDEIALIERARQLDTWVAAHPVDTPANVRHWLYQHAWIVTGARFGWWHGAQALEQLISADRRVETEWGLGARSLRQAQAALAAVRARTR